MLYLKKYRLGIGLFFLFVLIFFVIFALYGLPLGTVFYPALVFLALGGALVLLDSPRRSAGTASLRASRACPRR